MTLAQRIGRLANLVENHRRDRPYTGVLLTDDDMRDLHAAAQLLRRVEGLPAIDRRIKGLEEFYLGQSRAHMEGERS